MDMHCPNCGSPHIQLCAVVYADGRHNFQANHVVTTADGQFVQGSRYGTQMTALAQHCAPPVPPSPMPFLIAYGAGGVFTYLSMVSCPLFSRECAFHGLAHIDWKQAAVGLGIIGLGWLLMKGWYSQTRAYSVEKRQWQNTWFCHTCGQMHL